MESVVLAFVLNICNAVSIIWTKHTVEIDALVFIVAASELGVLSCVDDRIELLQSVMNSVFLQPDVVVSNSSCLCTRMMVMMMTTIIEFL